MSTIILGVLLLLGLATIWFGAFACGISAPQRMWGDRRLRIARLGTVLWAVGLIWTLAAVYLLVAGAR